MKITLTVLIRTPSSANLREHWAAKARRVKKQREAARLFLSQTDLTRFRMSAEVTLTRIAPRRLDGDNCASALKGIRDGVADALGVDDGDPRIAWHYGQERGEPREHGVRIEISEGIGRPGAGCARRDL